MLLFYVTETMRKERLYEKDTSVGYRWNHRIRVGEDGLTPGMTADELDKLFAGTKSPV